MITWGQVSAINHLMVAIAIRSSLWLRPFFLSSRSRGRRPDRGRDRESRLRAGGAGAKRLRKSKRIGRRGAGIREQKARGGCAAIGWARRRRGELEEGARGRIAAMERDRVRERRRKRERRRGERATPGAILLEFK